MTTVFFCPSLLSPQDILSGGVRKSGGAMATIASFTAGGLFAGQTPEFFEVVNQLAQAADAAKREG
jgi:hypothetical protein